MVCCCIPLVGLPQNAVLLMQHCPYLSHGTWLFFCYCDALFFMFQHRVGTPEENIFYCFSEGAKRQQFIFWNTEGVSLFVAVLVRAPNERSEVSGWANGRNGSWRRSVAYGDHIKMIGKTEGFNHWCVTPPYALFPLWHHIDDISAERWQRGW